MNLFFGQIKEGKDLSFESTSQKYMEIETWKNINGYEGRYQVSSLGRIKSLARIRGANGGQFLQKEKILAQMTKPAGYKQVTLSINNTQQRKLVHRLVAEAFIENPEHKEQVNHRDGNTGNNNVSNLEWCTPGENGLHSYRVLGNQTWSKGKFGAEHSTSKPVIQKDLSGRIIKRWDCAMDAVRSGFDSSAISRCCSGEYQSHKGFVWEFAK